MGRDVKASGNYGVWATLSRHSPRQTQNNHRNLSHDMRSPGTEVIVGPLNTKHQYYRIDSNVQWHNPVSTLKLEVQYCSETLVATWLTACYHSQWHTTSAGPLTCPICVTIIFRNHCENRSCKPLKGLKRSPSNYSPPLLFSSSKQ
jgi:hypothetical protein